MLKKICFTFLILLPSLLRAQDVSVLLFAAKPVKQVSIEPMVGQYKLFSNNKKIGKLKKGVPVLLTADSLIRITFIDKGKSKEYANVKFQYYLPFFKKLFHKHDTAQIICVSPTDTTIKARNYEGSLDASCSKQILKLVNTLPMDKYLPGVVEAEVGPNTLPECYKAQAIICRSYAYRNFSKHSKDACNLCDDVHCQAYKGMSVKNTNIKSAVMATSGIVAMGQDGKPINGLFSANCGGQTANSEDVWSGKEDYLRSVADPHCINTRQAKWEKTVPAKTWLELMKKNGLQFTDTANIENFTSIITARQKDYKTIYGSMPYTKIRSGLGLRSAYFSVEAKNDAIKLSGYGYGHGVGLCQEGSMAMAKKGFNFEQIITFYFTGVKLQPYKN